MMLLHGEQYTEILEPPLPTAADIVTEGTISGIYDKGKGALVTIDFITQRQEDEKPLIKNVMGVFIRGEGGFGGDAKSPEVGQQPARSRAGRRGRVPDADAPGAPLPPLGRQEPAPRRSDDGEDGRLRRAHPARPLHVRQPRPRGHRGVHATTSPERFKSIQVRFSKPVFPGETIVSQMWKVSDTEIICKARVKERDLDVITNAKVTLTK